MLLQMVVVGSSFTAAGGVLLVSSCVDSCLCCWWLLALCRCCIGSRVSWGASAPHLQGRARPEGFRSCSAADGEMRVPELLLPVFVMGVGAVLRSRMDGNDE